MKMVAKLMILTLAMLCAMAPDASAQSKSPGGEDETVLVGRISHVQGKLLRYVPDEKDWVAAIADAPFGLDDSLYADEETKAEFIMPNNTWIRIGADTQIQMLTLRSDLTEVDVASGIARFFNNSRSGVIKVTTPFGYVTGPAGTRFDLYVGDESLEVIALKGRVNFIHEGDDARYEVIAGSSSIVADKQQVTSGEATVDADWDDWNVERDKLWSKRVEVKGDSVRYLPEELHDDAYSLEENGRWERVYYEGSYRRFWRPARVASGWTPFSAGRWTVYHDDQTWIPDEPFGYVTHHYGNWVSVGGSWYWAPPAPRVRVRVIGPPPPPPLAIGFSWYPGRVGWLHSSAHVGWFPLAPFEPYYAHRHWGPRSMVIHRVNVTRIDMRPDRYRFFDRAVFVDRDRLYRVNNYRDVKVTNINKTTIINNYRTAPVINKTVINNYETTRERYRFRDINVDRKPQQWVVNRIERNRQLAREPRAINADVVRRNVARVREGRPVQGVNVERPRVTNRLVREDEVNRPREELNLPKRELKRRAKPVQAIAEEPPRPGGEDRRGPNDRERRRGEPAREGGREGRPSGPNRLIEEEGRPGQPDDNGRRARPPKPDRQLQNEGDGPGEDRGRRPRSPREDRINSDSTDVMPQGREERRERKERREQREQQLERPTQPGSEVPPPQSREERRERRRERQERREQVEQPGRDGTDVMPLGREERREERRERREQREQQLEQPGGVQPAPPQTRDDRREERQTGRERRERLEQEQAKARPQQGKDQREERRVQRERREQARAAVAPGKVEERRQERKERRERIEQPNAEATPRVREDRREERRARREQVERPAQGRSDVVPQSRAERREERRERKERREQMEQDQIMGQQN